MGNILYTKQNDKGALNYFCGNVTKVTPPKEPNRPYSLNIKLSLMTAPKKFEVKTVTLNAWNSEKAKRADSIARMNIHEGSYIHGVCGDLEERKSSKGNYTFINARLFGASYSGRTDIQDGDKSYILLSGRVGNIHEFKEGISFGLVVDGYDRDTKEKTSDWYNVNVGGAVLERMKKTGRLQKGVQMTVLAQVVETEKETTNPVVRCLRFDFADKPKEKK